MNGNIICREQEGKVGAEGERHCVQGRMGGSSLGTGEKPECCAPDANRWGGVVLVLVH